MLAAKKESRPEYTLAGAIAELLGYLRGQRIFPIELAESALYWLERAPRGTTGDGQDTLEHTIVRLTEWLGNEDPNLPETLIESSLYWLRRAKAAA